MRKFILVIVVAITLSFASSAQASFVSMFDFNGFLHYDDRGGLNPELVFCAEGFGVDCGMTQIDPPLIGAVPAGYRSLGALDYTLDINLPEEKQELPYWLELSFSADGTKQVIGGSSEVFGIDFYDMFDLGNQTFPPDADIEALAQVLFGSIPPAFGIADFNFQYQGDSNAGTVLFGSNNQIPHLANQTLWLAYSGNVTLTGHTDNNQVVPEPATFFLFGSGLVGAFVRRRRRS